MSPHKSRSQRIRYVFGSKRRDACWYGGAYRAKAAGIGHACKGPGGWTPVCPHCDLPVLPTDAWDECHVGAPKAHGGKRTSPGHRPCNQRDNRLVVTPAAARAKRRAAKAAGEKGPGLGRYPMPAGRFSTVKRKVGGGVVARPARYAATRRAVASLTPLTEVSP